VGTGSIGVVIISEAGLLNGITRGTLVQQECLACIRSGVLFYLDEDSAAWFALLHVLHVCASD